MNLVRRFQSLLAPASLLGLCIVFAGCGGSGSGSSSTSLQPLKQEIAASIQQGFSARASVSSGSPTPAPTRAEGEASFNEFYGLWAKAVAGGEDFFEDEALTQPAGQERTTTTIGEDSSFSQTSTVSITAGKLAGYQLSSTTSFAAGKLTVAVTGTDPLTGSFQTNGFFEGGAGEFTSEYTDSQGVRRTYTVRFNADGTSQVIFNTGANYIYTLNFLADGSGTGSVTGSNPLLPAQIEWNTSGDGLMTFADGTTLEIKGFDFVQF